ncbi:MAG TPA: Rieske 2Fe-2S domain-containing protein [Acidimicrobiales bacterium]|nr:Rieske 2Fe-2S domain-containing protein [Acidimicrobiales bacterium]
MLIPLRLFLGVTFVFAGLQKLADPQFFNDNSPTSIHAQLVGAEQSSPIHGLLAGLVHIAPAVGAIIAIGELAVGLGVLVGLWTRVAALGGMAISLGLFLTVSFDSSPYFTGSDIVFFFAWTPILIAGAGGAPALDTYLGRLGPASGGTAMDRRTLLGRAATTGVLAAAVLATGGLAAWIGRLAGGTKAAADSERGTGTIATTPTAPTSTTPVPASTTTPTTPTTTVPKPAGHRLGPSSDVPVGSAAQFTDPASGDPGLVLQPAAGTFVAFSAICPHAGCTVAFAQSSDIIACPCHGSEFNARTGAVERGPATRGLTAIPVAAADGNLYVDG